MSFDEHKSTICEVVKSWLDGNTKDEFVYKLDMNIYSNKQKIKEVKNSFYELITCEINKQLDAINRSTIGGSLFIFFKEDDLIACLIEDTTSSESDETYSLDEI